MTMFLSADEIRTEVASGHIRIQPFLPTLLKPASYVLRLGDEFAKWRQGGDPIVPWAEKAAERHLVLEGVMKSYVVPPGGFVLGATLESISISHDLVGILSTLSHIARFGIAVHMDSFWVSPGFGVKSPTRLTLEISSFNSSPIKVEAGMPICHLAFARTKGLAQSNLPLENSIYEGHRAPAAPMLYEEFRGILSDLAGGEHE